jgi:23S rRNA pseudouridine2457 synthase
MARLLLFNKPFGMLSQFTDAGTDTARATLSACRRGPRRLSGRAA